MRSPLLVERALALVPEVEEFLPLVSALIGASRPDEAKTWARAGAYATVGKRVLDAERLPALVPVVVEQVRERVLGLFTLVVEAIQHQQAGDSVAAAHALVRAGEMEEAAGWPDRAETIYGLALEIAEELRDKGPQILALRRAGRVARTAGRLDRAWSRYEQSYALATEQGDVAGAVIACQGLGNVCHDRAQRAQARRWYEQGLALSARGADDPTTVWPFYTNLASVAIQDGDLEEADALLARARELIDRTGDAAARLLWDNNYGKLLEYRRDAIGAERIYREALGRCTSPAQEITIRYNLGLVLIPQERLFEAEREAREAEEIAIRSRLIPPLVDVYELLGRIACARRDEEGFVFYEGALAIYREHGLPQVALASVSHGYGTLLRVCGREPEAAAYLEQAREVYARLGLAPELARVEAELAAVQAVSGDAAREPDPVG